MSCLKCVQANCLRSAETISSVRKGLGKLQHVAEGLVVEAPAELGFQLSPQRGDNLLAVGRPFMLQNVCLDSAADVPIQRRQRRIDRSRDARASLDDHRPQLSQQRCVHTPLACHSLGLFSVR